jgi:hypothetical protein
MLIQVRGQTCRRVEATDRDAPCEVFGGGVKEMDSRSRSQFGVEFVRLTTEQQDRILGGMEHPAIQIETAIEGQMPSNLRCSRPARDCLAKKKLKAFNFRLADPQNRLFAGPERERSPTNEVSFSSRDLCSSRFAGRHGAPAIQIETATEGAKGRRACAAADQLAMPRQKKLKVFKF